MLIKNAWKTSSISQNYASDKWQDFDDVVDRLNSPELVSIYMQDNISFDHEARQRKARVGRWYPPRETFDEKKGNCNEQARFTLYCLLENGFSYDNFETHKNNAACGLAARLEDPADPKSHMTCLYGKDNEFYIINDGVIQGSLLSIEEAAEATRPGWEVYMFCNVDYEVTKTVKRFKEQVDSPSFSIPSGTYDHFLVVTINTSTDRAQIFYTLDDTEPSATSFKYSGPLEIRKAGTIVIKAIALKEGCQASPVTTAIYTIDYGDAPLGETGGLHYVSWDFGTSNFRSVVINIEIYDEPDNNDGLYFQMYQGRLNGVGFYFGIQTDVYKPGVGSTGKGLILSRWETRDLSNVRTVEGGWSQSAGYEGNFVGIRKHYEWTTHSYQLKVAYIETDDTGDWYGVWMSDLDNGAEDFLGSIRFPKVEPSKAGIKNGGITWTELYYKKIQETPIPNWHVSINDIYAIDLKGETICPNHATSTYSKIGHTDIYYDKTTKRIHFLMGPKVNRAHDASKLF